MPDNRSPLIVYLHGTPGSGGELALVGGDSALGPDVYTPNRFGIDPHSDIGAAFDRLAEMICKEGGARPIHLIGFSLGAFVALQVASRLGGNCARLDLISAAAPLELGTFLPDMAGQAVFNAARAGGWRFRALVWLQATLARFMQGMFTSTLFASAAPADRALLAGEGFRARYRDVLRASFVDGGAGYRREVAAYVRPWAGCLANVSADTTLWHGNADNWAPLAMAEALQAALPSGAKLNRLAGLSHYSALASALSAIADEVR